MSAVKKKGAAIILALMITAIVASIAATMMYRERIGIREATLVFNYDRLSLLADQAVDWAKFELTIQRTQTTTDENVLANTTNVFKPFELLTPSGAKLIASLQDQQALFNINCLANPANQFRFVQLIQALDPTVTSAQALALAKAITAWLTPSNADEYYLNQQPPYRAAHQLMVSISELRLVEGVTPQIYTLLAPYITALPTVTYQLNIDTAALPLLVTLAPDITLNKAKSLQACQAQQGGPATTTSFQTCATGLGITNISSVITTTSQYFMLRIDAQAQDQQFTQQSLLYRYASQAPPPSEKTVLLATVLVTEA